MRNQLHNNNQNINKNTDIISTLIHEYLYRKEYTKTLNKVGSEKYTAPEIKIKVEIPNSFFNYQKILFPNK